MPKRKETKRTKTKTTRIVKSAIAKGKGIAQNQSVVVNIQKEKAKRTYRRKPKQPSQVFSSLGTSTTTLTNPIPPPTQYNQINPFPGVGLRIGLPTDNQLSINAIPKYSNTVNDGSVSPISNESTFDNANRSNDFINNPFDNTAKQMDESDISVFESDIPVRRIITRKKQINSPAPMLAVAVVKPPRKIRGPQRNSQEMLMAIQQDAIRRQEKVDEATQRAEKQVTKTRAPNRPREVIQKENEDKELRRQAREQKKRDDATTPKKPPYLKL